MTREGGEGGREGWDERVEVEVEVRMMMMMMVEWQVRRRGGCWHSITAIGPDHLP